MDRFPAQLEERHDSVRAALPGTIQHWNLNLNPPHTRNSGYLRTKHYDSSATYLHAAIDQSLRRLQTDYLDLFLVHRPDPLVAFDEIADAAERLLASGKIRAFGVSNFSARQFDLLQAKTALCVNQIELSPFAADALQDAMLETLALANASAMVWSPLGGGRLFSESDPAAVRVREAMKLIQVKVGASSWLEIAYAWIFRLPGEPYLVTGSRRLDALREALNGLALTLSREDWFAILEAARGQPVD
ncbi:aldo/keto reductase [Burkholderia multivorans]|uniref:aldo/keto reductase n=1 Tax=Burkholderia multivorans TaxID=87883 RepID=UPI002ED1258E|nr:aldo/keto reductase [Burkholderia multivorans]